MIRWICHHNYSSQSTINFLFLFPDLNASPVIAWPCQSFTPNVRPLIACQRQLISYNSKSLSSRPNFKPQHCLKYMATPTINQYSHLMGIRRFVFALLDRFRQVRKLACRRWNIEYWIIQTFTRNRNRLSPLSR